MHSCILRKGEVEKGQLKGTLAPVKPSGQHRQLFRVGLGDSVGLLREGGIHGILENSGRDGLTSNRISTHGLRGIRVQG